MVFPDIITVTARLCDFITTVPYALNVYYLCAGY